MTLRVLLLAPPGAGKGTQAKAISAHFAIPHVSTGELFRRHVAEGTSLGQQVEEFLDHGDLVTDQIVLSMVGEAVREAMITAGGYLLDGFPRNLTQAREGYRIAKELNGIAHAVLHFEVTEPELMRRLLARGGTDGRSDDNEATIRHRLDVYNTQTAPLLDYYRGRGVLVSVDAEQPVEVVTAETLAALEGFREAAEV